MHLLRHAACAALTLLALAIPPAALAAPADVRVRIEGVHETIVDRVIRTDGHAIRASSDSAPRRCDGTNAGRFPAPGPTPTAAAVDALALRRLDFGGRWTPGFDDYFITRLGPEAENADLAHYWMLAVDGVATAVGGCQLRLAAGNEVLWANDGQNGRPLLWLDGPQTVAVGEPLSLRVRSAKAGQPEGARVAFAGATLSTVDALGLPAAGQLTQSLASDGGGQATVRFGTAGWHRVKARAASTPGGDSPAAIASAALAVCVTGPGVPSCAGTPPGEDPLAPPIVDPGPPQQPPAEQPKPNPPGAAPSLTAPTFLSGYAKRRQVGVGWTVTAAGVGVASWTVTSRPEAKATAPFVQRAAGTGASTRARLTLPAGISSLVRLTIVDSAGRSAGTDVGTVLVPIDERASKVKRSGRWRSSSDKAAWGGKIATGSAGAKLRVKLAAGVPTVLVRGVRKTARIELRAGGRREVYEIKGSKSSRTREITLSKQVKAGVLEVRVVRGKVGVDGVAVS